jgi:hypothetical protein
MSMPSAGCPTSDIFAVKTVPYHARRGDDNDSVTLRVLGNSAQNRTLNQH